TLRWEQVEFISRLLEPVIILQKTPRICVVRRVEIFYKPKIRMTAIFYLFVLSDQKTVFIQIITLEGKIIRVYSHKLIIS
ncbi:TPA: hypothetical protein ACYHGJ_002884, partial [Staphylococcus aureus]